ESIYKELESEKDKHEKDYHKAQITFKELENDYKLLNQKMETFKNELKRKEQLEDDIKSLEGELTILTILEKILDKFREDLISRIKPELSVRATYYLDMLTNGKYNELEVAEGYNINISDNGDKFELDRFSGGEQDVANLCLRLAISELAADRRDTRFQFIVLDEIFGSLDFERREAVLNALGNLRRRFRQIFVITHLEDIKDRLENVIMVEELPDGSSRARFA
ncbi:MAG: AAA family ATPase, partial [candidate division Zixibacteria bacterium]|nr:AAA family ATPase [candidate division Zixibacteria bacterium]